MLELDQTAVVPSMSTVVPVHTPCHSILHNGITVHIKCEDATLCKTNLIIYIADAYYNSDTASITGSESQGLNQPCPISSWEPIQEWLLIWIHSIWIISELFLDLLWNNSMFGWNIIFIK